MNKKPIALVTGTSSGIGLETAVQLAQAGHTVVATMRDPSRVDNLRARADEAGVTLDIRPLDVQDQPGIDRCIAAVTAAHGGLDVLVNNAGAGFLGTLESTGEADAQRVMDVNFFGVWRVTRSVLPLMRAAGSGRIVTVTSIGGLLGQPFNDAYCAAKFAVEGLMESLAPVVRRLGVHVSLVEPGAVHSEFLASVIGQREPLEPELERAYGPMLTAYEQAAAQVYAGAGQQSAAVAGCIVTAVTDPAPHFRYQTSELIRTLVARKYVDPTGDSVVALSGARLP